MKEEAMDVKNGREKCNNEKKKKNCKSRQEKIKKKAEINRFFY